MSSSMEAPIVFIAPNFCRCCHSSGFFTDMSAEFTTPEGKVVYEDVLKKTFNIEIFSLDKGTVQSTKHICYSCIHKLQEAYAFRNMVVVNEIKMLEHIESAQNKETENANTLNDFGNCIVKSEIFVKEEECIQENYECMKNVTQPVYTDNGIILKEEPRDEIEEVSSESSTTLTTMKSKTKISKIKGITVNEECRNENEEKFIEPSTAFTTVESKIKTSETKDSECGGDSKNEFDAPGPSTENSLLTEIVRNKFVTTYTKQDFEPSGEILSTDKRSTKRSKLQIMIEQDNSQMEVEKQNQIQNPRLIIGFRMKSAPKSNAQRAREFRARQAVLKKLNVLQPSRTVRSATSDVNQNGRPMVKTAAQRSREYRQRKKLAKQMMLKQASDQGLSDSDIDSAMSVSQ